MRLKSALQNMEPFVRTFPFVCLTIQGGLRWALVGLFREVTQPHRHQTIAHYIQRKTRSLGLFLVKVFSEVPSDDHQCVCRH